MKRLATFALVAGAVVTTSVSTASAGPLNISVVFNLNQSPPNNPIRVRRPQIDCIRSECGAKAK
jgi:hypothetical protein